MDFSVFSQKKILVTGHTGFKGSWLYSFLKLLGANVYGISLPPVSSGIFSTLGLEGEKNSHYIDILNKESLEETILRINPDVCFHLAAQSLVLNSYIDPMNSYQTNIVGTLNLFHALSKCSNIKAIITITTDKVYQENFNGFPHVESDPLGGGMDPYSTSKSAVEMIIKSWREVHRIGDRDVKIVAARSGNVIGGGDVSKNRLIPDLIYALKNNSICDIRNPDHIRPWQHVLDPVFGYLLIAEKTLRNVEISGEFNFGPTPNKKVTVRDVAEMTCLFWGGEGEKRVHYPELKTGVHETAELSLNSARAHNELGWNPLLDIEKSVKWTIDWEIKSNKLNSSEVTLMQIHDYLGLL